MHQRNIVTYVFSPAPIVNACLPRSTGKSPSQLSHASCNTVATGEYCLLSFKSKSLSFEDCFQLLLRLQFTTVDQLSIWNISGARYVSSAYTAFFFCNAIKFSPWSRVDDLVLFRAELDLVHDVIDLVDISDNFGCIISFPPVVVLVHEEANSG